MAGYVPEGRDWLETLLVRAHTPPSSPSAAAVRAAALNTAGYLSVWLDDHDAARGHLEAGLALWREIPPWLAALGGPQTPPVVWVGAAMVGFLLPDLDLRRRLKARGSRLVAELPAVLDQLVIATSAGLSLEQALDHTAASSDGLAADELRRLVAELGLGRWRSLQDALDRRNGIPELRSLLGQLRAAHRQGVPVGQVLAAQADALRERRKAEIVEAGGRARLARVLPPARSGRLLPWAYQLPAGGPSLVVQLGIRGQDHGTDPRGTTHSTGWRVTAATSSKSPS